MRSRRIEKGARQDPATSKARQAGEAARFVEPLGGEIVAEYFDIGQSRSLPWERTIAAVLENPQYTGYAVYGRWQKVEELLDPDDVATGHVVRFRWSPQAKIVRSGHPAHPAIVSVETFTAAQLEKRKRRSGGNTDWSARNRRRVSKRRLYLFRGRIKCWICVRRMEGAARRGDTIYYRCNARTLVPGSATACGKDGARDSLKGEGSQPGRTRGGRRPVGAIVTALTLAQPEELGELYSSLRLALTCG